MLSLGGVVIALYWSTSFSGGAWFTAATLLMFAGFGKAAADREWRAGAGQESVVAGLPRSVADR
jgi:hypothetical protein